MKFQIGDKVKFLNQSGGGVVSRIASPSLVYVNIEDGFEIPTATSDLIKMEITGKAASFFEEDFNVSAPVRQHPEKNTEPEYEESYGVSSLPGSLKRSANPEGIYLAWAPHDQKWLITGNIDLFVVNYSNLELLYNIFQKKDKNRLCGLDYGSIPAYSKALVASFSREEVEAHSEGHLQILFHTDETQAPYLPLNAGFKINPVRFVKEDNYREYAFFPGKAFIYLVSEIKSLKIVGQEVMAEKYGEEIPQVEAKQVLPESFISKHKTAHREAIVDLHIEAMVVDHARLKPEEIRDLQLAYFSRCLEAAIQENYYKVTFIHGVGNGILKNFLRDKLKEYRSVYFQAAPMAKFGIGAIDVMITHERGIE
ncbi:MAG: DUF2027 domain-containing protein [Bacteroidales bacterium]|jgi:hypothetical protein|nr:DUF2027 domain-containing protein [Bacteroidales bacterium]